MASHLEVCITHELTFANFRMEAEMNGGFEREASEALKMARHWRGENLRAPASSTSGQKLLRKFNVTENALSGFLHHARIARDLVNRLSDRERSTLTLIVKGFSNKQIAHEMNLSPRTVENHRANAFTKINARTTADAVRTGIYAGLDAEP
ncbi:LuxR C-terminal-related transcriptional regulator [Aurantiacibacter luteus]|uniref:LuxR C-terminal-related transcriptional regulator n=1 Tax=Aurantiacibacter luteus TaxID=1581420 RepID=UPI0009E58945|nr:LuxR C-terminal-related transcriptional regulator [Aurantiacibacter luteus]